MEGEKADEARKKIARSFTKVLKEKASKKAASDSDSETSGDESASSADDVAIDAELAT